jgi:Protein of unknown function (DUF4233)
VSPRGAAAGGERSLRRSFAALVLSGEILVVGFAALVAKDLSGAAGRTVLLVAAAVAALCVVAAATLRSRVGFVLGWVVQLLLVASAVWVPLMAFVGLLFAALWLAALVLGGRADEVSARRRAAASR